MAGKWWVSKAPSLEREETPWEGGNPPLVDRSVAEKTASVFVKCENIPRGESVVEWPLVSGCFAFSSFWGCILQYLGSECCSSSL